MWDSDYAPFFFNAGVASMSIYYSHRQVSSGALFAITFRRFNI